MNVEKFPNPPIKEAIFSVKYKDELPIELLEGFCNMEFIAKNYPTFKKSIIRQLHPVDQNQQETSFKNLQDGFLLESTQKGERVIRAKKTHLSFHKIDKYIQWEDLVEEFRTICGQLKAVSENDIFLEEISVRYINQIPFEGELKEFFKLLPAEVEGLPQQMGNFFMQVALPFQDLNGIITETITQSANSTKPIFIIDLKVIHNLNLSMESSAIWEAFERMREYKNRLFFSIITEKTKPLFR